VNNRGTDAESRALQYLQTQGLKLIARNWKARQGELDLIMLDRQVIAVTEVRARGSRAFGGAAASVDRRKQAHIIQTTRAWLLANPRYRRNDLRFDVVAIDGDAIEWIRNAFDASE
jgi:putative endonuclease